MGRVATFVWPLPDNAAISSLQSLAAAGNLLLNGTLSNPNVSGIILDGISRQVTLASATNLSAINFTVTGTYLGKAISEVIAGPNANTVSTTSYFNTITRISANAGTGAGTVRAGTGADGHTNPYLVNYHATVCALSAEVIVTEGAGDLTYSFLSTLQEMDDNFDVSNGSLTIYNMRSSDVSPNVGMHATLPIVPTGSTPPDYEVPVYGQLPVRYCWFSVDGSLVDPASAIFRILQQGIT